MAMSHHDALSVLAATRRANDRHDHDLGRRLAVAVGLASGFRLHSLGNGHGPSLGLGLALAQPQRA